MAGFADRNSALGNLHKKPNGEINQSVQYAVNFIALLFIFFECLPVFVKLMSGRDSYDQAIESQKIVQQYESETSVDVEKTAIDKIADYRIDVSIKKRMDRLNDEYHSQK